MVPAGGLWGMLDGVDIHGGPCGPRVRAVGGPALGWRWVSTVASRSGYAAAGFGGGDTSDYVTVLIILPGVRYGEVRERNRKEFYSFVILTVLWVEHNTLCWAP